MLFSVAISSAAPQAGGFISDVPAWIIEGVSRAVPTSMSQLSWDSASVAAVQVPMLVAAAWPAESQSV